MARRSGRAIVDVVADVSRFGAQVKRDVNAALKRALPREIDVDVDVKTKKAEKSAKAVETTFGRVAAVMASRFAIVGSGISAALLAAVPAASQLLAALAPAAGIVAALPAAAFAAQAAMQTLKLGLLGVSDAIEAQFGDNAEKAKEALEKLAPAAQDFVKQIKTIQPAFKGLQLDVQQRLFAGLGKELKSLSGVVLPAMKSQLPPIAQGFNEWAVEVANTVRQGRFMTDVNTILSGTPPLMNDLVLAIRPVIEGFTALAAGGVSSLRLLAGWIVSAAQRFSEWAQAAADSGKITDWIEQAIVTLATLADIIRNIGVITSSVMKAAGVDGGNLLQTFDNMTRSAAEFLSTAEGLSGVQALFSSLGVVSGAVLSALGAVLPELVDGLREAGPGLRDLSAALAGVLVAVGPLLEPAGTLIGLIAGDLATGLTAVTPLIVGLSSALGTLLGPIAGSEAALWGLLTAWTAWKVAVWATTVQTIPAAVAAFIVLATTQGVAAAASFTLSTAATAAWTAIGGPIGLIVIGIAAVVAALVWLEVRFHFVEAAARGVGAAAVWLWQSAIKPAVAGIVAAAMWLWNSGIKPAFDGIVVAVRAVGAAAVWLWQSAIVPAATAIGAAAMWLWNTVLSPAFTAITALVRGVGAAIMWVGSVFGQPIMAIAGLVFFVWKSVFLIAFEAIKALIVTTGMVIASLWTTFVQPTFAAVGAAAMWLWRTGIQPSMQLIGAIVMWLWSAAIQPAFTLIMAILRAVGGVVSWLWGVIRTALTAAGNAFMWLWRAAIQPSMSLMMSLVRSAISRVVADAGRVKAFVETISRNFTAAVNAVRARLNDMVNLVRGIPKRITSAVGNLLSLLRNAGRQIVQGLINGINDKIGALKDKASQLAGIVRRFLPFSPAKEGPLSGAGAPERSGARIATTLAQGMAAGTGDIRAAATALAAAARLPAPTGLDVFGQGALSRSLTDRLANPPGTGSRGVTVVFSAGSIAVTFTGAAPTEEQARATGEAIGHGIAATLTRTDLSTQIRTL